MAEAIREEFGVEAELIPGSGGVFDVHADDRQVWSKHDVGRFPENDEVLSRIKKTKAAV